ncbi:MAG TPA: formate dehydrogenase subunit gamma [Burkholderiales bacterium]|nr:formate dehydrogenase subunit gamma [Burkholderiales bacterium]
MHGNFLTRWAARSALALAVLFVSPAIVMAQQQPAQLGAAEVPGAAEGQAAQVQRQQTQPLNNAPVMRDIRSGEINPYQTTQVRGVETNVLIQTEGEIWRRIRNGPLTVYGGWLVVLVVVAIGLFYWRRGRIRLHEPRTGRNILRFNAWERTVHWATAISFVILAISGLVLLFGKYVLLPVFGYTLFAWLAILCKNLHNFVGPLFVICTVLMFATFVRDNLPQRGDALWLRKGGGMFSGTHVPSWRFNAGEKVWFWLGVTVLGLVVSVTGFILDFPNFEQGRNVMQQTTVIHAVAAVLFIAMSLGHIYLGTIGLEGSYDSMRHGVVDETWAKEHHEYWYHEEMAKRGRAGGATPAAVPASPVKEGWKL